MDLKFLGGASEVGRSGFLLKGSRHMLLDYGIKVDGKVDYPISGEKVDLCVVSHAHLDHSGFVPSLYLSGMPQTMGTIPTIKLAELLIEDSMKINRNRHEKPVFFKRQLKTMMDRYLPCDYGQPVVFGDYTVTLHDAGHISGSALTSIEDKRGRKLLYTGDFKLGEQLFQGGAEVVKTDILITESTYATKDHPDRKELERAFVQEVRETIDNGGTALIPVFAVGRSQEMLGVLYRNGLIEHTFVDGMARAATEIVSRYPDFIKNGEILQKAINNSVSVEVHGHRRAALRGGKIILTTSGMLNGGPVLNYITRLSRNSHIFLTGYQVEGTNGRRLLEGNPLIIDNRKFSVKCGVSFYDFSAHADRADLLRYAKGCGAHTVICVHGSPENTRALADTFKAEGLDAYAPNVGDVLKIDFE